MKKYIFTFEWENGCVNDYIRRYLKENGINYFYQYQEIVADLYGIGQYFKFDYEHIKGNTYGVIAIKTESNTCDKSIPCCGCSEMETCTLEK